MVEKRVAGFKSAQQIRQSSFEFDVSRSDLTQLGRSVGGIGVQQRFKLRSKLRMILIQSLLR